MAKTEKKDILHIVLSGAAWLIFAVCLVRFFIAYGSLPEEIGIHFSGSGGFDVIDRKIFGLYPFAVSLITLLLCALFCRLAKRLKAGKNVSPKGEIITRKAIILFVDLVQLLWVAFFSGIWSDRVIRQEPLNTTFPYILMLIIFGLFAVLIILLIVVSLVYRVKKDNENKDK